MLVAKRIFEENELNVDLLKEEYKNCFVKNLIGDINLETKKKIDKNIV